MVFERILIYCSKNDISIAAFERMCDIGNGTIKSGNTLNHLSEP